MTPSAKTSARLSSGFPRTCSGAMYEKVPRTAPASVSLRAEVDATPKSISFATPSRVTMTLWGVTSRWTMRSARPARSLRSWAWWSASEACTRIASATLRGITCPDFAPSRQRSATVSPSTYSMAMYQ